MIRQNRKKSSRVTFFRAQEPEPVVEQWTKNCSILLLVLTTRNVCIKSEFLFFHQSSQFVAQ